VLAQLAHFGLADQPDKPDQRQREEDQETNDVSSGGISVCFAEGMQQGIETRDNRIEAISDFHRRIHPIKAQYTPFRL
jgi:hypothetical protein